MKFDRYEKDTIFTEGAYSQFDSGLRNAIAGRREMNGQTLNAKRPRNVFATWVFVITLIVEIVWFLASLIGLAVFDNTEILLIANVTRGLINGMILLILILSHCFGPNIFYTKTEAECIGYLFIRNGGALMLSISPVFQYEFGGQQYRAVENIDRRRFVVLPDVGATETILVSPKNPVNIRWKSSRYETGILVTTVITAIVFWSISVLITALVMMG